MNIYLSFEIFLLVFFSKMFNGDCVTAFTLKTSEICKLSQYKRDVIMGHYNGDRFRAKENI